MGGCWAVCEPWRRSLTGLCAREHRREASAAVASHARLVLHPLDRRREVRVSLPPTIQAWLSAWRGGGGSASVSVGTSSLLWQIWLSAAALLSLCTHALSSKGAWPLNSNDGWPSIRMAVGRSVRMVQLAPQFEWCGWCTSLPTSERCAPSLRIVPPKVELAVEIVGEPIITAGPASGVRVSE
jgi:hypothetical protein